MYVPRHNAMDPLRISELLRPVRAMQLVTATAAGPQVTLLPLIYEPPRPGGGPREDADGRPDLGRFIGHMSRVNPQWQSPVLGDALVVVEGADAYVSTRWMPDQLAAGVAIPTWNYETVHAFGTLVVHDDVRWARDAAVALTTRFEPDYDFDALPRTLREGSLRAIVGIEVVVTRIEAKSKLSQNRTVGDLRTIIEALRDQGDGELADQTERWSCPYAAQRDEAVSQAAQRRDRG